MLAYDWKLAITDAYHSVKKARISGDQLHIDLAENALNDLLQKYRETVVTRNKGAKK